MTGRANFKALRAELTPAQQVAVSAKVIALTDEMTRANSTIRASVPVRP